MSTKVNFQRGTIAQFQALEQKNANTFYAVVDEDNDNVELYLGDVLLSQPDKMNFDDIDAAIADSVKYQ